MATKNYSKDKGDIIQVPRFEEANGFYTTAKQSKRMAKVRSKNTKAEVLLRKMLWSKGIRFRIHVKNMPGTPDIVINKYRLAIFVDGGFWHGYQWSKNKKNIKTNAQFWISKIERNMQRDYANKLKLQDVGYTVMRFWDHEVIKSHDKCINQILLYVESASVDAIPES